MTNISDEYMEDVDPSTALITMLQSEIMDMLGHMIVKRPQRQPQASGTLHKSTPFVVVLIDGNENMLLADHVKQGYYGGRKAAQRFHAHLFKYLTRRKVFQNHWRLVIKFYASMSNLGTIYMREGLLNELSTWRQFIDGFNNAFPFCQFLDAGDEDEKVSSLIQGQLSIFFNHCNCKHTVLVSSPSDSYAGFLRQFVKTDDMCGRITFIEAIPFPGSFHELSKKFLPSDKKGLFGTDNDHRPLPQAKRSARPKLNGLPGTLRPELTHPSSTAFNRSPERRALPPSHSQVARREPLTTIQARLPRPRNVFFNSQGQRIDSKAYISTYTERYLQC